MRQTHTLLASFHFYNNFEKIKETTDISTVQIIIPFIQFSFPLLLLVTMSQSSHLFCVKSALKKNVTFS